MRASIFVEYSVNEHSSPDAKRVSTRSSDGKLTNTRKAIMWNSMQIVHFRSAAF